MLLAATIIAILLHIAVAEKTGFSKAYEYSESKAQIYVDHSASEKAKLAFARCNPALPKLEKQCIISMKLEAFEKTAGETKECTVNLKPELSYGLINNDTGVYAFGKDKVLLIWTETGSDTDSKNPSEWTILKTTVVHMFDSCRTFEAKVQKYPGDAIIHLDVQYINTIVFEKTYELRLGESKDGCRSRFQCSLHYRHYKFDDQGRKIGEPEDWPKPPFNDNRDYSSTVSIKLRQPEKAYFIINRNKTSVIVELMDKASNGYRKLQSWENSCNPLLTGFGSSLANEAIGFCYSCSNSSISCWQADQKGHIHTRIQFTLDVPRELSFVHNLRNGGLLLAIPKCSYSDCHGNKHRNSNQYLMVVDAKSNVQSVEVQFENECNLADNNFYTSIFENKQGQYCIVGFCESHPNKPPRLETLVSCYSSDEFSKCSNCL